MEEARMQDLSQGVALDAYQNSDFKSGEKIEKFTARIGVVEFAEPIKVPCSRDQFQQIATATEAGDRIKVMVVGTLDVKTEAKAGRDGSAYTKTQLVGTPMGLKLAQAKGS